MNLKAIRRISEWETKRQLSGADRKTAIVSFFLVLITIAITLFSGAPSVGEGIYSAGVVEDSGYESALSQYERTNLKTYETQEELFTALENGEVDAIITKNGQIISDKDSRKGQAASSSISTAVEKYNRKQLLQEDDQIAAYPVIISINYIEQRQGALQQQAGTVGEDSDRTNNGGSNDQSDGNSQDDFSDEADQIKNEEFSGDKTPSEIQPPFPFRSLIIAFAFLIPMNFLVQSYASSIIDERLNQRGEMLLVSPISQYDIIIGKSLPYFLAITGLVSIISVIVGGGVISILAILPFALAYLSSGFLAGIFARSYKELTFVVLAITLFFTTFGFIPAVFTSVLPIASISPLTIVVLQLEGKSVPISSFLFATIPLLATSLLMFVLGAGIYREEELFTQKRVPNKFLDALAAQQSSWRSPFWISFASIPFVFAAELLAIATLFVIPRILAIPVLLLILAFIEEVAKSLSIRAAIKSGVIKNNNKYAVLAGFASGFGFLIAEKLFVLSQVVGLTDVGLGQLAFSTTSGIVSGIGVLSVIVAILLHPITASISAIGARKGGIFYVISVLIATLVHLTYNLIMVITYGF